ncbi:UNVERIFIED_CONTAM: ATP-dependent DNA helicase Q-like 3 [Sesamum radiatum]|uniref:ATP-dependent DNA helicase Q-like 3 n=1 Tax=Sesamum radiatum TaxID=300843 RepID=A0AAW2NNS5_SESRA
MSKSSLPLQNVCGSEKQVIKKEALVKILRWHFGHSDFRGKQLEAIQAVLSGRDCFCLMPTGGGKSMCYQIPALAKQGIVLVENQVAALKEKGIAAEYLSSTQTVKAKSKEFILGTAASKKLTSSSMEEGSSRKALANFRQMIEYCEESGCRRKKILESFGEEVAASLCAKSCDACKHPNVVSKNLEELTSIATFRHRNGSSRIYISSSSDFNDEAQFSEFWNRDDEATGSEEDISDSDDPTEIAKSVAHSSRSSEWRLRERMESLQRAEENYYRSKNNQEKQVNKVDKNSISGTLRESGKQRLLNAMKQNLHRFGNFPIDSATSAETLEAECYKKYEKSGKSFYLSQIASTVRWLSTATPDELTKRVGTDTNTPPEAVRPAPSCSSPSSSSFNLVVKQADEEKVSSSIKSNSVSRDTAPPPILSFSEFINRRKSTDNKVSMSKRPLSDGVSRGMERKTKS